MDIRTARYRLLQALRGLYDPREASRVADMVMEHVTGLSRSQQLVHDTDPLAGALAADWERCLGELLAWRPVQYVLGEAWFAGLRLQVDERVLIPRPETEELVEWCLSNRPPAHARILDAGTGSGCIALALRKALPQADILAADVSPPALEVATANARNTGLPLRFLELDLLDRSAMGQLPELDIILSNPPYVPASDRTEMRDNVLRYEPHLALFVADTDPLRFYDAIADMALDRLVSGGSLYFEIHEARGPQALRLLERKGFRETALRQDLSGRDRMVHALRP